LEQCFVLLISQDLVLLESYKPMRCMLAINIKGHGVARLTGVQLYVGMAAAAVIAQACSLSNAC
jgi:hypothetical protein